MVFKDIVDAFTKSNMVKQTYEEVGEMHHELERMFKEARNCLVGGGTINKVVEEDVLVNKKQIHIRKQIINYLAMNSAPDVTAALELVEIASEYERIGDYCKNLSQLETIYGINLSNDSPSKKIIEMTDLIEEEFHLVHDAVKYEDEKLAKKCEKRHKEMKVLHQELIECIKKHPEMKAVKAAVYSSAGTYCRRISAHLKNVSTAVTNPFPEMGFRLGKYTD
ncbi:MAG: PhoU domain-containing protein [Candidatus Diapherotrites archaeon]|nr:PhoU domain-containing protein [Candidatus Diapherotrites archaeon]